MLFYRCTLREHINHSYQSFQIWTILRYVLMFILNDRNNITFKRGYTFFYCLFSKTVFGIVFPSSSFFFSFKPSSDPRGRSAQNHRVVVLIIMKKTKKMWRSFLLPILSSLRKFFNDVYGRFLIFSFFFFLEIFQNDKLTTTREIIVVWKTKYRRKTYWYRDDIIMVGRNMFFFLTYKRIVFRCLIH